MNHKHFWTVAGIMAGIILLVFLLSAPHTRDIASKPSATIATATAPSVVIRDVYKKGVHTITGSIKAPDACSTVSAQATLVGDASSTQSILVAVTMPDDVGICLEVPTTASFTVTVTAPPHTPITATVNDVTATTTAP